MHSIRHAVLIVAAAGILGSCAPSTESTKTETPSALSTKEGMYTQGHQLYLEQQFDSARVLLERSLSLDAKYREPIIDLGSLHYDLAMRSADGKEKTIQLRKSRDYFVRLEELGDTQSETYERLCEIADALNDHRAFLKYARKNVQQYPYERQYYNLSVAYFNAGDYQGTIRAMKEAVEKFKRSAFIGSFYRQMGRAYMKVDRDQTAERTFYAGLSAVDNKIAELRKENAAYQSTDEYQRLKDDTIGMLISLKNLHTIYGAKQKLADVEKKLKDLGR